MRLRDAHLCVACECVVEATKQGCCPLCGSAALLALAPVLGGSLYADVTAHDLLWLRAVGISVAGV